MKTAVKSKAKRKTNTWGIRIPKIEKIVQVVRANVQVNTVSAYILKSFDENKTLSDKQRDQLVGHYIHIVRTRSKKKKKLEKLAANTPPSTSPNVILRKAI